MTQKRTLRATDFDHVCVVLIQRQYLALWSEWFWDSTATSSLISKLHIANCSFNKVVFWTKTTIQTPWSDTVWVSSTKICRWVNLWQEVRCTHCFIIRAHKSKRLKTTVTERKRNFTIQCKNMGLLQEWIIKCDTLKKQWKFSCTEMYTQSAASLLTVTAAVWTRIDVQSDFSTKECFKCSMVDLRRQVGAWRCPVAASV